MISSPIGVLWAKIQLLACSLKQMMLLHEGQTFLKRLLNYSVLSSKGKLQNSHGECDSQHYWFA